MLKPPLAPDAPASRRRARLLVVAQALWPCAFYFVCSFAMNMLTKTLLTGYAWRAIYALGAVQNTFTMLAIGGYQLLAALLAAWRRRGRRPDAAPKLNKPVTSPPTRSRGRFALRVLLPLVALHIGNMMLGFAAMRMVNMPMYLVLRRLTTVKVMLIESLVLHKQLSTGIKLALLVSTTGSILAGGTDATFEPVGYALVILQNVCTACSLTFSKECELPSGQIVLLNSIAGSAVCAALAFALERDFVAAFAYDPSFLALVVLMCCVCVLYQFAIMICTIRNSALATSVTGNVKDLASTTCGFLFFSDVQIRAANIAGVALSLIGSYSFSYLKFLALTQSVTVAKPPPPVLHVSNGDAAVASSSAQAHTTRRRPGAIKEE